jgi:glycosyltransferase involved in cell wall biosynthesis
MEILVVDDGSTDDTERIVREFGPEVRYIRLEHSGPSRPRNVGIEESSGDYVAFNDDDDLWLPESLSRRIPLLEAHPEVGFVFSDLRQFKGEKTLTASWMADRTVFQEVPKKEAGDRGYVFTESLFPYLARERFMTIPTLMVRRSCLEEAGGFDEELGFNEDFDLFLRLAMARPGGYIDLPLAACRVHEKNISGNTELRYRSGIPLWRKFAYAYSPMTEEYRAIALRQLARTFHRVGYFYFEQGRTREARKHFAEARKLHNRGDGTVWYWLLSFLPAAFTRMLRRLKQR